MDRSADYKIRKLTNCFQSANQRSTAVETAPQQASNKSWI
ncbi:hypothetical protein CPter291_3892 [Collimonas pratensis]|uniref:Uncharacterized protein n=1 Tax=Collimonas pratensis TaxID=279113 RepID=A0A127R1I4_9BURK|nr:hypothetical protein CPter91_3884 [Collimonas pratensis]AMP16126.1 hypothetical protein CPter291_3892 [Collimonas pratensis]